MFMALALLVTLSWTAPTLNSDNTAVAAPLTYTVFQGAKGAVKPAVASNLTAVSYTPDLTKGVCFEVATTDKSGDTGPHSAEACAPAWPLAPGALKFVLTVTP